MMASLNWQTQRKDANKDLNNFIKNKTLPKVLMNWNMCERFISAYSMLIKPQSESLFSICIKVKNEYDPTFE